MNQMAGRLTRRMVVVLALAGHACGGNTQAVVPEEGDFRGDASMTVEVENRNFSDATIYVVDGGTRQRLGRVNGKSTLTFRFRWYRQQLAMVADFTGGGEAASELLTVHPETGNDLRLVIGASNSSRPTLRPRT
jgi:hypothetical protein